MNNPSCFCSREKNIPFYERRAEIAPSFYFVMRGERWMYNNYLRHGGPGSGRYPKGSGKNPRAGRSGSHTYKRYASDVSDDEKSKTVKEAALDRAYRNVVGNKSDKLGKVKNAVDQAERMVDNARRTNAEQMRKSVRKEKLDLSQMTDQQMREKINRELLERQYTSLFAKDVSTVTKGQKAVDKALSVGGTVLAAGSTALSIALMIKELKK